MLLLNKSVQTLERQLGPKWSRHKLKPVRDEFKAPQSSSRSGGIESSLFALHALHLSFRRLCSQMLPPPHSLHRVLPVYIVCMVFMISNSYPKCHTMAM